MTDNPTRKHDAAGGTDQSKDASTADSTVGPATSDAGFTRRGYVRALGAASVAGSLGASTLGSAAAQSSGFDSFVDVDGTDFVVDGAPQYFAGSNNFWLTNSEAISQSRIDDALDLFVDMGLDVVRMWANGAGSNKLQPNPGEYDEQHLRVHDYVIKAAGERGLRVIPSLVDNWSHEGGMAQYAAWVTGDSFDRNNYTLTDGLHSVFYTDPEARQLYKDHVDTIVKRENYYTGTEWREDPTIMMWELANEPRLEANWNYEGDQYDRQSGEHREILGNWIQDMSAYIKELDPNHLVSTGSEGHRFQQGASYPYGTWSGQDYVEHHSYDTIDAASFHWYPDHWDLSLDAGSEWITNHVQDAHEELGKPAYLGEFNVDDTAHDLETKNQYLQSWYDTADEVDCNAAIVWQIVLDSTEDHDGFQIYRSESGDIVESYAQAMAEKSEDSGGSEPPTDTTCGGQTVANKTTVDGQTVCDVNGDGLYRDFDANGEVSHADVQEFFSVQHRPTWKQPSMFDFNENQMVGHGDVVALFEDVAKSGL